MKYAIKNKKPEPSPHEMSLEYGENSIKLVCDGYTVLEITNDGYLRRKRHLVVCLGLTLDRLGRIALWD